MSEQRWSASFSHSERYTAPSGSGEAFVVVDGEQLPATILGRNGPRAQVRFTREGSTYVRWFDAAAVIEPAEEPPAQQSYG